eukprot:TRINITY_DN30619_c0_g1_i1.p1 TRINITY_DN30619_c0_g1~~TRINITY_DN30619_c0_g1_i1.p1  ORF type:complete len:1089 (+),score=324.90 TRINITY_DN30619_c0_g1_i1:63-3269(+)
MPGWRSPHGSDPPLSDCASAAPSSVVPVAASSSDRTPLLGGASRGGVRAAAKSAYDRQAAPAPRLLLSGCGVPHVNGIYDLTAEPSDGKPQWRRGRAYIRWRLGCWEVCQVRVRRGGERQLYRCAEQGSLPPVNGWEVGFGDTGAYPPPTVAPYEPRSAWLCLVCKMPEEERLLHAHPRGASVDVGLILDREALGDVSEGKATGFQKFCVDFWGSSETCHIGCTSTAQMRRAAILVLRDWPALGRALQQERSRGGDIDLPQVTDLDLSSLTMDSTELLTATELLLPSFYWRVREREVMAAGGEARQEGASWIDWVQQAEDDGMYPLHSVYWERLAAFEVVVEALSGENVLLAALPLDLKVEIIRRRLTACGLLVDVGLSPGGDRCYVRTTATTAQLLAFAERQRVELRTDEQGILGGAAEVFTEDLHSKVVFRIGQPQLQRLLARMIRAPQDLSGAGVPFDVMDATVESFGPLHDSSHAEELGLARWKSLWRGWHDLAADFGKFHWSPDDVAAEADYLGEKVGLYFLWIQSYTRALYPPAAVGALVGMYELLAGGSAEGTVPQVAFVLVLIVWAQVWNTIWAAREHSFAHRFGTDVEAAQETLRCGFRGCERPVHVPKLDFHLPLTIWPKKVPVSRDALGDEGGGSDSGSDGDGDVLTTQLVEVVYPEHKRRIALFLIAVPVVLLLVGASFSILLVVTSWRFAQKDDDVWVTTVASVITTAQMMVFSLLFDYVSRALNWIENYRTETEYENALIRKMFVYQFFNAYSALFVIALWPDAENSDRLEQLRAQMLMNVLVKPLLMNAVELGLPWLSSRASRYLDSRRQRRAAAAPDADAPASSRPVTDWLFLRPYHGRRTQRDQDTWRQVTEEQYSPFNDYLEIVLQFGYMAMFAQVFPWGPLCSCVLNVLEVRIDAKKVMSISRRPVAQAARDIGAWRDVFTVLTLCACVTNAYTVCFLTTILQEQLSVQDTQEARTRAFLASQYALFATVVAVRLLMDDVPQRIRKKLAKEQWMSSEYRLRRAGARKRQRRGSKDGEGGRQRSVSMHKCKAAGVTDSDAVWLTRSLAAD